MSDERKLKDILGELHTEVATSLLDKIKSGEATPSEISAAITLLKNNGITAPLDTPAALPVTKLLVALPFDTAETG